MIRLTNLVSWMTFIIAVPTATAAERELYATDFSNFAVGEDQLVGNEGWTGTNLGEGVHGIDEGLIEGLGKTAYLGSNVPAAGTEFVNVDHMLAKPLTGQVKFQALFGINESTEGGNDVFGFDFLNERNEVMAALLFDTSLIDYGIWTDDGTDSHTSDGTFVTGLLNFLTVSIDLEANVWSADLEGTPLFTEIPFTTLTTSLSIASIGLEWQIADVADPGDNWILFDNVTLSAIEPDEEPVPTPDSNFRITSIRNHADGKLIEWPNTPGVRYQVEYSTNGIDWKRDLPASEVPAEESADTVTFIDPSPLQESLRLYRVIWLDPAP